MHTSTARCAAVWLCVTVAAACAGRWACAGPHDGVRPGASFEAALASGAGLVLAACAAWAWSVTTLVVVTALRDGRRATSVSVRAVPAWAQRLVLGACGVALVGVVPATAHASPGGPGGPGGPGVAVVAGLALPDRTTGRLSGPDLAGGTRPDRPRDGVVGAAAGRVVTGLGAPSTVTVRPGDSLWSIAERLLGPGAGTADVAALVTRLHTVNRARIGPDPDLIHPGHQLRTPLGVRPAR